MKIVLASASPRRKEILELAGLAPDEIIPSDADETVPEGLTPDETVRILAKRKGEGVRPKAGEDALVISSDTVVALGNEILGKPADRDDARRMLRLLSGKKHFVYTGVYITFRNRETLFCNATEVEFYELTDGEIEAYLDTGEPFDKAGAYGIQGRGCFLVKRIDGDFFSVMGLPAAEVYRAVRAINLEMKNEE
ncbi:MAG: septum formation protein Maf [Clostridia bacterium]|nr:septum formation protein Maf [Clostridia bacterium]